MIFKGQWQRSVLAAAGLLAGVAGCSTESIDEPTDVGSTVEAVQSLCTISLSSPQQATGATWGDIVHVDANASCPSGTPLVQFYERVGNVQWTLVKPYSTALSLDYDTHNASTVGSLQFYAAVYKQGTMESPTLSSTITVNLADNVPSCASVRLTSPLAGQTFQAGTNVTITGVANCPQTPEYEYWVKPTTTTIWTILPSSTTYASGSVTWVPPNQPGTWSVVAVARVIGAHVSYQVRSSSANITITAAAQNQPPVVNPVSMTVAENSSANVGTGSATDPDNDPLTVIAVGTPSHGSSATAGGMNFTYSPVAGYAGSDSFSYTVDDGHGHPTSNTVSVTVTTQNPVPGTHNLTTGRNQAVTTDLAAGDSDPDGDPVHVAAVGSATNGATVLNGDGTVTYTPNTGFVGNDAFTYTLADNHGGSATGNVSVTVGDQAPVAVDDGPFTTRGNTPLLNIPVMANDSDPDGDPISVVSVTPGVNGGSVSTDGTTVSYAPASNYLGPDSFTYTISDGVLTATATVTINVSEGVINCAGGSITLQSNSSVGFDAIATAGCGDVDGDTLTVTATNTPPAHGGLTLAPNGAAQYTANTNYVGGDSFSFTVDDGHGQTLLTSISVTVVDQAPTANPDSATTNMNQAVTFNVLTNDTDPDGGTLSVTSNTQPAHGTATVAADGTATYTPTTGYTGPDSFTYALSDGQGSGAVGTVNLTVNTVSAGCTVSVSSPDSAGVIYGQDMHWTASASCTTGAAQIQWWMAKPNGTFMMQGTWGSSTTLTVNATIVGTYKVYAQARTVGTTTPVATSNTVSIAVADNVPACTLTRVTFPASGSTFAGGTVLNLAATATCPAGVTPEYQFWVKKSTDSTFTILPGYTQTTMPWTTPVGNPGTWGITVVVRGVGAHVPYTARSNSIAITLN